MKTLIFKTVAHNVHVAIFIAKAMMDKAITIAPYVATLVATLAIVLAPSVIVALVVLTDPQGIAFFLAWFASFAACCANVLMVTRMHK